ncbi:hypothetical protein LUZ63_016026 [Rhynchospora breviuscula]|uniref:Germin-like protein n=1 Tax=Rhynchospora breviuscula TaxID=2022672 RepID=A0A9Q0HMM6_9POAL|nr:hypothetical protein LUZ63_016026 [Rhynchospora breviuscula]
MNTNYELFLCTTLLVLVFLPCYRADPDPLQDFCIADPKSGITVNGFACKAARAAQSSDFFSSALRKGGSTDNPNGSNATRMDVTVFPGLNTLGVSMNRVDFEEGGINPPHVHPRASEVGYVAEGILYVGILSTENKLYSKILKAGESFVMPRGLLHFQYNMGPGKATQFVSFDSQKPGIAFAPQTLFGSKPEIPTEILAKAFRVDADIIEYIKSKFQDDCSSGVEAA